MNCGLFPSWATEHIAAVLARAFSHSVATCWVLLSRICSFPNLSHRVATHRNSVAKRAQHVAPNNVALCLARAWLKPCLDLKGKALVNTHCKQNSYLGIRSLITISSQLRKLPKHIVVILSELWSELKRKTQLICATTDTFHFNNFNPICCFFLSSNHLHAIGGWVQLVFFLQIFTFVLVTKKRIMAEKQGCRKWELWELCSRINSQI